MKIKKYKEKEIRKAILNKVNPKKINKSGRHWKGYIYINDKLVAKVKIPNDHTKEMEHSKSKYIARDLKLECKEFNGLVDCNLRGSGYYMKLAQAIS